MATELDNEMAIDRARARHTLSTYPIGLLIGALEERERTQPGSFSAYDAQRVRALSARLNPPPLERP
ncbi:MAG TPA: hypothetical protein VLD59_09910 [Steroidobacteraceae bacterium]|nr:hypothetical protein [Steroidobacteraceae bacterium]